MVFERGMRLSVCKGGSGLRVALDVPTSLLTGLQTGDADFIYLLWNFVTVCNTVKNMNG